MLIFDSESSDLAASWGRILCCSFVPLDGEVYTFRGDRKPYKGKTLIDDSRLCAAIRDELEAADMVVGWNSILHDVPLINARLAKAGERPVRLGEKYGTWHWDAMYHSGGQSMKVGGRKLATISKFFGTESSKTGLDGEVWQLAAAGDKPAMDQVVEHCEADVLVLKELFPHLAPHVKKFTFHFSEVFPFISSIPSRKIAA